MQVFLAALTSGLDTRLGPNTIVVPRAFFSSFFEEIIPHGTEYILPHTSFATAVKPLLPLTDYDQIIMLVRPGTTAVTTLPHLVAFVILGLNSAIGTVDEAGDSKIRIYALDLTGEVHGTGSTYPGTMVAVKALVGQLIRAYRPELHQDLQIRQLDVPGQRTAIGCGFLALLAGMICATSSDKLLAVSSPTLEKVVWREALKRWNFGNPKFDPANSAPSALLPIPSETGPPPPSSLATFPQQRNHFDNDHQSPVGMPSARSFNSMDESERGESAVESETRYGETSDFIPSVEGEVDVDMCQEELGSGCFGQQAGKQSVGGDGGTGTQGVGGSGGGLGGGGGMRLHRSAAILEGGGRWILQEHALGFLLPVALLLRHHDRHLRLKHHKE